MMHGQKNIKKNDGDLMDAILLYFKLDNGPFFPHTVKLTAHYHATILRITAHRYTNNRPVGSPVLRFPDCWTYV